MRTADELQELLGRAWDMPYGAAQIALVEEVLRHVDTVDDPDLSFATRMMATTAYVYGGEPVKAFPTFAWCVSDFDRNPGPHHRRFAHNLLWDFKAMVSSLTRFPEIPLARTYAVLDDMERRYREGGHSMQSVYKRRHLVARHLGLTEEEDQWFERWQATPRDDLSDCRGCDPTSVLVYLNSRDRYEDAVAIAEPVLAGDLSCNEQPQNILTELMVPYLKTGRAAEAVDAHRRAYRRHRSQLADLGDIARHVAFCARTGNEHRGLEILQRHLDWLEKSPSPSAMMSFAAAGGLVLRRITEMGHGDLPVRRRDREDISAAALAEELAATAIEIARRFDARNGTDAQSRWVADQLAAEPFAVELVLSPTARQPSAVERPGRPTGPAEEAIEIPAGLGAAELLDLAREHARADRDAAAAAVLAAFDQRFPEVADPLLAGRRALLRGDQLRDALKEPVDGGAPADADREAFRAAWREAVELFTAAGALGEAATTRARIALDRAYSGEIDEDPIDANVAHQEQHGNPRERVGAWSMRAAVHLLRDRVVEANDAGDRADAYAEQVGDRRLLARQAITRAQHRAAAHRHEEAAEAARFAWDFFREHGPESVLAPVAAVFGQLTDDPAEQVEAFGVTLASGLPGPALVARVGRGRALLRLDRAAEAISDLVEAVALATEQSLVPGGAFARQDLAQAYRRAGRPVEAAEVAEEAVLGFLAAGLDQPADDTRYLLAGLYRELGDADAALTGYRDLLTRQADNPAGRGQIGEDVGGLLFDLDRDAEAAEEFRAAAQALHEAGDLVGELRILRRRVAALHFADEVEAAEETVRLAAARYDALPVELAAEPEAIWQQGMTGYEAARLLMSRGRFAEALPHSCEAPERLRRIGAEGEADHLTGMHGEALLRSGSPAEAEALLSGLLAGLAADSPARQAAEKVYAEAREALGNS